MDFVNQIMSFNPPDEQERQNKKVILHYIKQFPDNVLRRDNEIAHLTSSGFIMNKALDKVLMVHHNIRNNWSWTGGHVDGDPDFLHVALKEAREETGLKSITPLSDDIAAIDILPVYGHIRKDVYVNAHLHLSIAYLLVADDQETPIVKEDENSGVKWFPAERITLDHFSARDVSLYSKLVQRARLAGAALWGRF